MEKVILSFAVFFVLFQGVLAKRCLKYKYRSHRIYSTTYIHCRHGCCGTTSTSYCCRTVGVRPSVSHVSTIAGAVIGGIIGLSVLIAIIIAIIKACSRTATHGPVVQPVQYTQPNNGVFAVTSSAQPYPSTTQYGMASPPYTNQGVSYPPQQTLGTVRVG